MFGLPALGGQAGASNFNVDPSITDAIQKNPRAIVVTLDKETLTASAVLEPEESLHLDFAALKKILKDACVVLFRDDTWNLLSWKPSGTAVRKRTMYASCHGQLKKLLPTGGREYVMVEEEDISAEAYRAHVGGLSAEDRLAAMTVAEREKLEVEEEIRKEQETLPTRLAGLAAVEAPVASSWKEKVPSMSRGDYSILRFENKEMDGSVASGVEKLSALADELNVPSYIVWACEDQKILVVLWSPDTSNKEGVMLKMTLTSCKANFLQQLKKLVPNKQVASSEAHDIDDLNSIDLTRVFEADGDAEVVKPKPAGIPMPGLAGAVKMPGM